MFSTLRHCINALGPELVFSFSFSLSLNIIKEGGKQHLLLYRIQQLWRIFPSRKLTTFFRSLSSSKATYLLCGAFPIFQVQIITIQSVSPWLRVPTHIAVLLRSTVATRFQASAVRCWNLWQQKQSHELMYVQHLAKYIANIRCNLEVSWMNKWTVREMKRCLGHIFKGLNNEVNCIAWFYRPLLAYICCPLFNFTTGEWPLLGCLASPCKFGYSMALWGEVPITRIRFGRQIDCSQLNGVRQVGAGSLREWLL